MRINSIYKILLVAVLVLAASCETFTRKAGGDPDLTSFRIVCSEAAGVWTVVTGKTKTLLIAGNDDIEIDELDFGEDNCEVKLNKAN